MNRRGSSLVEVLIALGILVSGLLIAYSLLQSSFLGFKRLDRRQTAEAISLNIQDRYFHTSNTDLMKTFGGPAGSSSALENDELVVQNLPAPWTELKKLGFEMSAHAIGLDQGNGSTGLYFTTKVSWPVMGSRQYVTHSRVVASGLRPAELLALGASAETPPGTPPPPKTGKLLSLSVAGNVEAFGARAAAVEQALAGKGRAAAIVFEGSQRVMDQMAAAPVASATAPSGAAGFDQAGPSGRTWGGEGSSGSSGARVRREEASSPASTAAASGSWASSGGSSDDDESGWSSSGSGGTAAAGGVRGHRSGAASLRTTSAEGELAPEDGESGGGVAYEGTLTGGSGAEPGAPATRAALPRARSAKAPGAAPDATSLEGVTRDPVDFLRAAAPQLSPEERMRLVPGQTTTEDELARMWAPLEQRKVPPGVYRYTTQAYLHVTTTKVFRYEVLTLQAGEGTEAYPLISRRELTGGQVTGAYLEGDPVVERKELSGKGFVALCERTSERTYVTRPVILPDGAVAPFGREIAITEGKLPAPDWKLSTDSRPAPSEAFAAGTYQEKVQTPRAGEAVIEEVAVNWASTRSRDAKRTVESDAQGVQSSDRYRDAIEQINQGAPGKALEIVEQMRSSSPNPPIELERLYASLLVQLDRMDDAARAYQNLAARPEADASILNNLAFIEIHRGNHAGALSAANAAIAKDPAHLTAYVNAGIANEFLGKKEDAIAAYRRGLEKHPGAASLTEGLRRMGGL